MKTTPTLDWEKEFDRRFTELLQKHPDDRVYPEPAQKEVKDFIRSLLKQAVEEERERIKKAVKGIKEATRSGYGTFKYDSCFDDVLKILALKGNNIVI